MNEKPTHSSGSSVSSSDPNYNNSSNASDDIRVNDSASSASNESAGKIKHKRFRYLFLFVLIIWAVISLSARFILNHLDNYSETIKSLVEKETSYELNFAKISGRWLILSPLIELEDVTLIAQSNLTNDQNTLPSVTVKSLAIELDFITSLLTLSPKINRLLVDGLEVSVKHRPFNKNTVAVDKNSYHDTLNEKLQSVQDFLDDYILAANTLYFKDSSFIFEQGSVFGKRITIQNLMLSNSWFNHNLTIDAVLSDALGVDRSIESQLYFQGNPLNLDSFSAKFYLQVEQADLSFWTKKINLSHVAIDGIHAGIEAWIDIEKGVVHSLSTIVNAEDIQLLVGANNKIETIDDINFSSLWQGEVVLSRLMNKAYREAFLKMPHNIKFSEFSLNWQDLSIKNISFIADQRQVIQLNSPLAYSWSDFDEIAYHTHNINAQWMNEKSDQTPVILQRLVINEVPLNLINNLPFSLFDLEPRFHWLLDIQAEGKMKDLQLLSYRNESNVVEVYGSFYLQDAGVSGIRKVPSITGIDAYVELAPRGVAVELNTKNAMLKKSPYLFRKDIKVDTGKGYLFVDKLPQEIVLHTNKANFRNEWADLDLVFSLNIPERWYPDETKEPPLWSLAINFKPIPASNALSLFPATLPESFLSWFDEFLLDGKIHGDLFLLSFLKKHETQTFINFDADLFLEEGRLDYLPEKWPELHQVSSHIAIHNDRVQANVESAQMFDSEIKRATVLIPSYRTENLPRIQISGEISGGLQDVRQLFLTSELKESFGVLAEDWLLEGKHNSFLTMDFPITENNQHYDSQLLVDVDIDGASLSIQSLDLTINEFKSELQYSLASGLQAELIEGMLFNNPFIGSIATETILENSFIQINAESTMSADDLQGWQSFWLFNKLAGVSNFQTSISIGDIQVINDLSPIVGLPKVEEDQQIANYEGSINNNTAPTDDVYLQRQDIVRVDIQSDLQGMSIDLPGDYEKHKNDQVNAKLQFDIFNKETIYRAAYDTRQKGRAIGVSASLYEGDFEKARINFGKGPFPLPEEKGIIVTGQIDQLKYDEWRSYIEENILEKDAPASPTSQKSLLQEADQEMLLKMEEEKLSESNIQTVASDAEAFDSAAILNRIDLTIGHFFGFDQELKKVNTFITREKFTWRIEVESDMLSGVISVPDDPYLNRNNPIVAKLKYLKIDSTSMPTKSNESAKFDDDQDEKLTPNDFVFVSLDIDQVIVDKEKNGRWQVDFYPDRHGVDFDVHQLNYGLIVVNGKGRWNSKGKRSQSIFKGHLRTGAATRLFSTLNLKPSSNSGGLMAIDVSWPGSPLDFHGDKLKGTAGLEIFDGSIVEVDINSKKFKALGIFNLGILTDILTLNIFKKIGKRIEGVLKADEEE